MTAVAPAAYPGTVAQAMAETTVDTAPRRVVAPEPT